VTSGEVQRLIRQATAAFEAGEYDRASDLLRQAAEEAPGYANIFHMLGLIACQRNAPEKAVALFRRALHLNPKYREARVNLAITLAEMGAYDQAAVEVEALGGHEAKDPTQLSPGTLGRLANGHADLARQYHDLGLYAQAVVEYDKALELCPTFPDLHNRRATSCRELGDFAGAEASLRRALELNPEYVGAHVNLGLLQYRRGLVSEAMKSWQRALEIDPKHQLARIYLTQATTAGAARE
jgi:tetratricopeptide (TPR) repeat protein